MTGFTAAGLVASECVTWSIEGHRGDKPATTRQHGLLYGCRACNQRSPAIRSYTKTACFSDGNTGSLAGL